VIALDENELNSLLDYVRCIWLQISLQRLLELGARPSSAMEALGEVLDLGDWATANLSDLVATAVL
jgi:hypothetical protein